MKRARLEQPGVKLFKITDGCREQPLGMVRILGGLASLLNIQQRSRKLIAHPLQIADAAGRLFQFFGDDESAIVSSYRPGTS